MSEIFHVMSKFLPIVDIRLEVRHELRNRAGNGFPDGRDKVPKTLSKPLHVSTETAPLYFQPAKARGFEAFGSGSETLATKRNAWWARELCHSIWISIT
jgi:hypothetical protein